MRDKQNPLAFIKHFQNEGTIDVFMNGCCYWFAFILYTRFLHNGATMMNNEITGHFATMIDGRLYDIAGEIKEIDSNWTSFDEYCIKEPVYLQTIIRDCILKYPFWNTDDQYTDK